MILQKTKNYSPDKLNSIKQLSDYKDLVLQYAPIENEYRYALREMSAKLENLDDYCQIRFAHNPIHHIESRIKTLDSIIEKIERRGLQRRRIYKRNSERNCQYVSSGKFEGDWCCKKKVVMSERCLKELI